jgi:WbqC-like protein family
MKRTVVIHQPDFLPWLGFFHRLLHADLYIALDHVQFVTGTSRSWMHRDRIKTAAGPRWLTLSVRKAPLGTPIREILLSPDPSWRDDNLNLLRESYRKAPHFAEVFPRLERLYASGQPRLVDIALDSIALLCEMLDIHVEQSLSSAMAPAGTSNEMLVQLLREVGATHYLSGSGARNYFDPAPFARAGIEVVWQEFAHPSYPQLHGEFVPMLSAIDMLFNCGIVRSRELLRSC